MALMQVPGLSAKIIHLLLNTVDRSAEALWQAPASFFKPHLTPGQLASLIEHRAQTDVSGLLGPYQTQNIHLIPWIHPDYPPLLAETHGLPLLLYVKGNIKALGERNLAIVGTRRMSDYGQRVTRKIVTELKPGFPTIVSGLAEGIDGCAHRSALDNGLPTVAVFGCGLDIIFPSKHKPLAQDILAAGGALISEYPLGFHGSKASFPQRNRIVAGCSSGVLVVEGNIRSGSLITSRLAMEENRVVFAVPGNLFSPEAEGPHYLIKQGAVPATGGLDILQELKWEPPEPSKKPSVKASSKQKTFQQATPEPWSQLLVDLPEPQGTILLAISYDPMPVDQLVKTLNLPTEEVFTALTMLELSDRIKTLPGNCVCRL